MIFADAVADLTTTAQTDVLSMAGVATVVLTVAFTVFVIWLTNLIIRKAVKFANYH